LLHGLRQADFVDDEQEAMMRKLATALVAVLFLLGAGMALADQVIGVVEKIDPGTQTIS
jgi:hypothetical protein